MEPDMDVVLGHLEGWAGGRTVLLGDNSGG